MKKMMMTLGALAMCALAAYAASPTATLVKTRRKASQDVVPGVWHAGFSKCKAYAVANRVPLIAVWSNGDACGHCWMFEEAVNHSYFRNWMKNSGIVFYFIHSGDGGDGAVASSVFHWCRKNKNTAYPFVRIYWPAGKVDIATVGDTVDGGKSKEAGAKKAVAYFKAKLKNFKPGPEFEGDYNIEFNGNGATNETAMADASIATKGGVNVKLPLNAYLLPDYSFAGWAKSETGAVAYANGATVRNVTTVSNSTVTLYAKWTHITYRTYYVGLSSTIDMGLKGWTCATKVPGLTWNSKTGKWTGKPTKAGTYTVTLKKSKSSVKRKIVIVKDSIVWGDDSVLDKVGKAGETMIVKLEPTSLAGDLQEGSVEVTGLPEGFVYEDGVIAGSTTMVGTFKVNVTATSAAGQKLSRVYNLKVEVPEFCIGTFYGFVGTKTADDPLSFDENGRGSFTLSAPESANLSAKVITAKGTYSFTAVGWKANDDGSYTATLKSAKKTDTLEIKLTQDLCSEEGLSCIGTFAPAYLTDNDTPYEVWAQLKPVKVTLDAEQISKLKGTWYLKVYSGPGGWTLGYGTSKSYNAKLVVAEDANGNLTAKLAGKIGSYTVSQTAAVIALSEDLASNRARVDFAIPVTVSKTKKTLDIWLNLWFDKSNSHYSQRGEGIGGAALKAFN